MNTNRPVKAGHSSGSATALPNTHCRQVDVVNFRKDWIMAGEFSLDLARLQNVKRHEDGSIRAACPACREADSDKSGNHLLIRASGKFGCAANQGDDKHRKIIFRLAGKRTSTTPATNGSGKRIVATYNYHDASGKTVFQVVRYSPKDFRQRRPDGNGGWIWKMAGVERVLYRLPEILRAVENANPIYICEGEKDCDVMKQLGFDATCNPGGAAKKADGEKWLNSYTDTLRGADVCIIADEILRAVENANPIYICEGEKDCDV